MQTITAWQGKAASVWCVRFLKPTSNIGKGIHGG